MMVVGSMEVLRVLEQLPVETGLLRFFERVEGYEVYGEDAVKVGTVLFQTANLSQIGPSGVPVLVVGVNQLATALRELLRDHRIEIWAFNAARKAWRVTAKASPGNLEQVEALLGDDFDAMTVPIIASVVARTAAEGGGGGGGGERRVGLAFADTTRFILGWASFVDNELWSNVDSALVQLDARECIFPPSTDLAQALETSSTIATALPARDFESETFAADLERLLVPSEAVALRGQELPLEVQAALGGLFSYLQLLDADSNLGAFKWTRLDLAQFMRLDETALKALNIFPTMPGTISLYSLLDKCKTRQGSRLLAQWLRQPLLRVAEIEARQDIIANLVENSMQRQQLRDTVLRGIPDVSRVARKLVKGKASLQDLVVLYFAVAKISPIYEQLAAMPALNAAQELLMAPLCALSANLSKYAELIESTVDFEALHRHEYIVRADVDPSLGTLHGEKEAVLDRIEREFDRVVRVVKLERGKKIKLERNPTYGYFFRISRLDGAVLSREEDFQELAALKNGIYFATPALRDLSLRYDELGRAYGAAQQTLVQEMLKVAGTYRRCFDELGQMIALVDVLQALAYVAVMSPIPLVRPTLLADGQVMRIKEGRHLCVESSGGAVTFIANNVEFDRAVASFQIITGPNMGGKSTFIRQAAMIALMAQVGAFVPCARAELPIFDAILVRVGAGDSILKGISTFMMEMLETAAILRTATERSLVVIDELGRGTSTSEGLGLAWGISRVLAQRRCFTFFATHFHELTELAQTEPNVRNLHAVASLEGAQGLVMTYRMEPGVAEQSFGVHVAKMAGFPPAVVDMANLLLRDFEGAGLEEERAREALVALERCRDLGDAPDLVKQLLPNVLG